MKSLDRALPVALAVLVFTAPLVASAAVIGGVSSNGFFLGFSSGGGGGFSSLGCNSSNICGIASTILFVINSILVPLLFAIAFIVFLYGVASAYIFSRGDSERVSDGHRLILWGLVGFAVMISLWGLVNVVANTFGLGGQGVPSLPTSFPPSPFFR